MLRRAAVFILLLSHLKKTKNIVAVEKEKALQPLAALIIPYKRSLFMICPWLTTKSKE